MLPEHIEYTGEYGVELGVFIPFVHFLKKNGVLKGVKIITYSGMRPYYFFLEDYEYQEKNEIRIFKYNLSRWFLPEHLQDEDALFKKGETVTGFLPPNYKKQFSGKMLSQLPLLLLQNKFNIEWNHDSPKNYFNIDELQYIFTELQDVFQIVYIRTNNYRDPSYSCDNNEIDSLNINDKEIIIQQFPKVVLIEKLLSENLSINFNMFKCHLESDAEVTISTIGGFNFFDAYFPSKHLIYKKEAPDIYNKTYYQNQHNLCCPGESSDIMFASNEDELKKYIQELKIMYKRPKIDMDSIMKAIDENTNISVL
jgi:hypothetical protein